jgi:hypothetical protein
VDRTILLFALLMPLACGSPRRAEPAGAEAGPELTELRAPLSELHAWFDSHRGHARFLAILSPS